MKKYLETPHGWYTIKGRTTQQAAERAAELHREQTGAPVALRYVPLSYPDCWKAIAKAVGSDEELEDRHTLNVLLGNR